MTNETHIPTREFARELHVKDESVRRSLCINGHYMGIKPLKLPNGRLLWPVSEIKKVFKSARESASDDDGINFYNKSGTIK